MTLAPSAPDSVPAPLPPPEGNTAAATLTPTELTAVLDVTLRAGQLMTTAGAAAFRVREVMRRTAVACGATRIEASCAFDALHATLFAGPHRVTETLRVEHVGVDMNRIVRLAQLSRELEKNPGRRRPEQLGAELDVIAKLPSPYPTWLTPWLLGASCGAFCGVIGGTPGQIGATFLGTCGGHLLRLHHLRRHPPMATVIVTCAFTSALVAWGAARLLGLVNVTFALGLEAAALAPGKAVMASVLYLIPGVPLVNGLIDLQHFDHGAGLARSAHATLVVVCIAIGMLSFLALTGFDLS